MFVDAFIDEETTRGDNALPPAVLDVIAMPFMLPPHPRFFSPQVHPITNRERP
jgi:hypothetical protein